MPLFIIGVLAYIPLCHTLPWLINKAIGEPFHANLTVSQKERSTKGHWCNEIKTKELQGDIFSNICVSQKAFNDLQVGDSVVVVGIGSWLGVDVSKYSYYANQQPTKVIGQLDFYSQ